MVNKMKRIGTVILMLTMLLSLNHTGVLAAEEDASGCNPKKDVSLSIFKYKYKEGVKYPESNGNPVTMPEGANPIQGVIFKIEKVKQKEGKNSKAPEDYEPVTGDDAFSTTGTTDKIGKVVFSTDSTKNTADKKLSGQGIYKVSEVKSATTGTAPIADFIVSLPMTNPNNDDDANPWLYDVFAYPKNDVKDTIKKEVVANETEGNSISWKYSAIIPNDINSSLTGKESLVITDVLDYRLSYVVDSIKGTYTTKEGSSENELINGTDYKLIILNDENDQTIQILKISITSAGFLKLQNATEVTGSNTPMLNFTFKTRIKPDALGEIKNGGEMEYTNSADYTYEKEEIEDTKKPKEDAYGINIFKINVNKEPLANAKFNIYISETDAQGGNGALQNPDGSTLTAVTNNDGYANLSGLIEGTYYLVEAQAPEGYKTLSNPIKVLINADKQNGEVTVTDDDRMVAITVTNDKGFELPKTGGMGTILFTVGGLVLIGIAFMLLTLVRKRK